MENNERSCNWCLVLYPEEDKTHQLALKFIEKNYDYAYIFHDSDITSTGELKKSHVHVVIRFKNQRWRNSIALDLGITPNYLQKCRNLQSSLKYLIHYDDQDKFQYDVNDVQGTLKKTLLELLEFSDMTEGDKFKVLMDFIYDYPTRLTLKDFMDYVITSSLFATYRKNAMTFNNLIREHNIALITYQK